MANSRLDVNSVFLEASSQFKGLNMNQPGQWPILPKLAAFAAVSVACLVLGYLVVVSSASQQLDAERAKEPTLKDTYHDKLTQAVNLEELRKQRVQVAEYVNQLEKQLPGKAEMDALLSDINQAGLGRGLQFELFKPGQVVIKDYYAELPISIKVAGRYHDIGAFAADIANLSRIVTLHNISIVPGNPKDSGSDLVMDATARTYRYLDQSELDEMRAAKNKDKKGAKK